MATIEHTNIADPFRHEPKNISTANAGEVYIADGAASGSWELVETYGEFNGINNRTGSYTLVLSDKGKLIEMDVSTANTLTIPPNASVAFPINTRIDVVQLGTGLTTIEAGSGVTIRSYEGRSAVNGQYSAATLYKRGTNEWVLAGSLA